jgi:hypothetical protein
MSFEHNSQRFCNIWIFKKSNVMWQFRNYQKKLHKIIKRGTILKKNNSEHFFFFENNTFLFVQCIVLFFLFPLPFIKCFCFKLHFSEAPCF